MMNFDVISGLLFDAQKELMNLKAYRTAEKEADETGDCEKLYSMRHPSKERIRDNMRVIRRLTLDIERELDKI